MRVAVPPVAGSTQMLPWKSTARRRPSGDTATDIDVPSCTVTSFTTGAASPGRGRAVPAGARPCDATSAMVLARLTATRAAAGTRMMVRSLGAADE